LAQPDRHTTHAVEIVKTPTSAGDVNVTSSGFRSPLAAIVFGNRTLVDDVFTTHLGMGIGFTDLTDNLCAAISAKTSANPSECDAGNYNTRVCTRLEVGTSTKQIGCQYDSLTTDGIVLDYVEAQEAYPDIHHALLLKNGIAQAKVVEKVAPGSGASTVTVGFKPDIIIVLGAGQTAAETGSTDAMLAMGFYHREDGTYFSCACFDQEAVNPSNCNSRSTASAIMANLNSSGTHETVTFGTFTDTTFDMTIGAGSATENLMFLCLKLQSSYRAAVGSFDTPTATGKKNIITGLNHQPDIAMFIGMGNTALDSGQALMSPSFSVAELINQQASIACSHVDAASGGGRAQNIQSTNYCLVGIEKTEVYLYRASLVAFESDGKVVVDFDKAPATAVKVGYLTIGKKNRLAMPSRNVTQRKTTAKQIVNSAGVPKAVADYEIGGRKFYQPDNSDAKHR